MVITKKEFSGKWELSRHDIQSIIYTMILIAIPVITYIQTQFMNGQEVDWRVAIAGGMGALLKVLQKLLTDYASELGGNTPTMYHNPTGREASTKAKDKRKGKK